MTFPTQTPAVCEGCKQAIHGGIASFKDPDTKKTIYFHAPTPERDCHADWLRKKGGA